MPYSPQNSSQAPGNNPLPIPQNSIVAKLPWLQIIVGGGVVFGLVVGGRAIGKKLGLVKDSDQVKGTDDLAKYPYLDQKFVTSLPVGSRVQLIKAEEAKDKADAIFTAKGMFKDNKDLIWAVLQALKYRSQLPVLATAFSSGHQKELASFLSTIFNSDEIKRFFSIMNALPSGVTLPDGTVKP